MSALFDSPQLFISGIDTDAGKTYATAWLARLLKEKGHSVITQKFIQTGCKDSSEDILAHRAILGEELHEADREGLTAPIILSYPASAQLAARIDGREIDTECISQATQRLSERYDRVLIEGAGGLMVPITDTYFTANYVAERHLPLVLVTEGKLGSINHTVLSLMAIKTLNIPLAGVIYNHHFDADPIIAEDTCTFIRRYVASHFPEATFLELPSL